MNESGLPRRMKRFERKEHESVQEERKQEQIPLQEQETEPEQKELEPETEIHESKEEFKEQKIEQLTKAREPSLFEKFFNRVFGKKEKRFSKEEEVKKIMQGLRATVQEGNKEKLSEEVKAQLPSEEFEEGALRNKSSKMSLQEVREFRRQHRRLPEGSEIDELAENIFDQLKSSMKEELTERKTYRDRRMQAKPEEKKQKEEAGKAEEKKKPLKGKEEEKEEEEEETEEAEEEEMEEEVKPVAVKPGKKIKPAVKAEEEQEIDLGEEFISEMPDFGEEDLTHIDLEEGIGKELNLDDLDEVEAIDTELGEESHKCPNCKSKTENIIFCPNCGSGFCTHCAKAAKPLGNKVKYQCPICSHEFQSKKR